MRHSLCNLVSIRVRSQNEGGIKFKYKYQRKLDTD